MDDIPDFLDIPDGGSACLFDIDSINNLSATCEAKRQWMHLYLSMRAREDDLGRLLLTRIIDIDSTRTWCILLIDDDVSGWGPFGSKYIVTHGPMKIPMATIALPDGDRITCDCHCRDDEGCPRARGLPSRIEGRPRMHEGCPHQRVEGCPHQCVRIFMHARTTSSGDLH